MLYIRMLLSMVVALYTSRVVLNTLGVEDYGIYSVVAGVVVMFTFLNGAMSGATSRFLTYEIGCGNQMRLKETFSSALLIHIAIAFVIFILAETIGLWFLIYKLVIPEERMFAAHIVYQLSVLSTMVSITQVPYNAVIISHEKMDIYAYVELLNVTLKLLIVFLLPILGNDKLVVYAFLVFIVSILIAFIYRIYCVRHYTEAHLCKRLNKDIVKPMLSFSGWDLYVNMALLGRNQGLNILLNLFFGPIINAAVSMGMTIQSVISAFGENILIAIKPHIIKLYAKGEYLELNRYIAMASSAATMMMGIISIPLIVELRFILYLWLGNYPEKCVEIAVLCLVFSLVYFAFRPIVFGLHAVGNIKMMGFYDGTIYLLVLPISYLLFKFKILNIELPFILNILLLVVAYGFINLFLLKKYLEFFSVKNFLKNILKLFFIILCAYFLSSILLTYFKQSFLRLILVIFLSVFIQIFLGYILLLEKKDRTLLKYFIINKLKF